MGKAGETLRIYCWSRFRLMGQADQYIITTWSAVGRVSRVGLVLKVAKMSEPRRQWKRLRIFQGEGRSAQGVCEGGVGFGSGSGDGEKC